MVFVLALIFEVLVLTAMEYFTWETAYTPLTCLMLPYTLVLLLTILAEGGNSGFVPFNYESIFVWNVGLILFAVPSYATGAVLKRFHVSMHRKPQMLELSKFQLILSLLLCCAFLWKLNMTSASSQALFGSDDFANDFAGRGLWAHLREILVCLVIMFIYYLDKRHWWLIIPIALMLFVQFVYMVKGSIIISVCAGYLLRLYSGKSHLNLKVLLGVVILAFSIFLIIYLVLPLMGNDEGEADLQLVGFVYEHFIYYLTSGTFGWSCDLDAGLKDQGDISVILSPFINLFNTITGSSEPLISAVNPLFLYTGTGSSNVRTFFGTLFIYTTFGQFALYTIALSCFLYLLKALTLFTGNFYFNSILFYYCGLLAMGWFEFYFFHLSIIEVPMLILLLAGVTWLSGLIPKYRLVLRRAKV